jgi:hypothetical protein
LDKDEALLLMNVQGIIVRQVGNVQQFEPKLRKVSEMRCGPLFSLHGRLAFASIYSLAALMRIFSGCDW